MTKFGVLLHDPSFGTKRLSKTFTSKQEAKRYGKKQARAFDITANAAIFPLDNPNAKEWLF